MINLRSLAALFVVLIAVACGPFHPASAAQPTPNDYQQALAFARCMRAHGISDFPDPQASGGFNLNKTNPTGDLNPASSAYQTAMTACHNLLPAGKSNRNGISAADRQKLVAFSACMRSHGVPDFPDPNFSGGNAGIEITNPSGDLSPNSPTFQAAQHACESLLPGSPSGSSPSTQATGSGQ